MVSRVQPSVTATSITSAQTGEIMGEVTRAEMEAYFRRNFQTDVTSNLSSSDAFYNYRSGSSHSVAGRSPCCSPLLPPRHEQSTLTAANDLPQSYPGAFQHAQIDKALHQSNRCRQTIATKRFPVP